MAKNFEACIDLHEEECEFLKAWNELLVDHNVSDDSWLHGIFRVKEKWAWAYVRKTFTADVMNIKIIPQHYILKRWARDARLGSNRDWKGQHIELDIKAHFTKRHNELCPRMIKLTDKASQSHETYTFLSKVCEESNKIIDVMLAKKSMGGESIGKCDVSISIANEKIDNNVNNIDFGGAKGIKKRDCSFKGTKQPKSWVEKLARKRKGNLSQKKRKTQENLEQSVATSAGILSLDTSLTFTQLLTQPLHCMSMSQSSNHINHNESQYGSGTQLLNASQGENASLYLNFNEANNGNQHGSTSQMT
ncbi:FAR1-related protein [Sesbania bispinosa]|nr:FAR1-related protein [Sesbania bispinosa]